MARYGTAAIAPVDSGTTKTVLGLQAQTTNRVFLYDWMFGSSAVPDDNAIHHFIQRFTSPPLAGTANAAKALDPADPTAGTTCLESCTTGTYTSGEVVLRIPANQRASHRWVAAPDGEIVAPATLNNGLGYKAQHASHSGDVGTTMHWWE
jgi:hypothetical protein